MIEILMQICIYVNRIRKIMRILRVFYPKKLIVNGILSRRLKKTAAVRITMCSGS